MQILGLLAEVVMPELVIGCSGFNYRHWRGIFYPEKLPQKKWFEYYWNVFSSVELNVTFYRLPRPDTFDLWYRETPPSFVFAIKGSRFITHVKRLADTEEATSRFFDAALHLREKLKVVLWQLPPGFSLNLERFRTFLALLSTYQVRHTFEFRNQTWLTPEVIAACREHGASLCAADAPPFLAAPPTTADHVYIRRHGHDMNYTGCYSDDELQEDARRIRKYMGEGRDVYIYFNNDLGGHAPRNARDLMGILK